jgi:hypothetical protein
MAAIIEGQRNFTVEEYHRMGEAGVFAADERVELIRGVVRRMSPKGKRHSASVSRATRLFVGRLAGRACVFVQDALRVVGWTSEPEPDLIVASNPDPLTYGTDQSQTLLVIEVADATLAFDREVKGPLYAEAGIPEYWIVNLVEDVLEVYRDPRDGLYQSRAVLSREERIAPRAFPDLEMPVNDLLP